MEINVTKLSMDMTKLEMDYVTKLKMDMAKLEMDIA